MAKTTSDPARPSWLTQIEEKYEEFQGSVRQVADTVLASPNDWVGKSITELARKSEVSEATVVRFVRTLGYPGYRAYALALAGAAPATRSGTRPSSADSESVDGLGAVVKQVFETEAQALLQATQTLQSEPLEKAIKALLSAEQVYCYAPGNSALLARTAEYRFVRLGINCISVRDPIQMAVQTSLISDKDVVLAFSQTGRNSDAVDSLLLARRAGATTIGVTTEPKSPLVGASDIALVLFDGKADESESLLDTKIAEMTLVDALAACIASRRRTSAKEATRVDQQIEKMLIRRQSHRGPRPRNELQTTSTWSSRRATPETRS